MRCNFLNRLEVKKSDKNSTFLLQCKNANKISVHKRKNQNISSGYLPAQSQQ